MANDYEEGDYSGFAGEAVAGGFRIVKTQVVSVISRHPRPPRSRPAPDPVPGARLLPRALRLGLETADEKSKFVRSPSVAVIPVKVQLNWGVAKASAQGRPGEGRRAGHVRPLRRRAGLDPLDARGRPQAAGALHRRPEPPRPARERPGGGGVPAQVLELGVLTLADQNKTSVDQLVKDLTAQRRRPRATSRRRPSTSWHGQLKTGARRRDRLPRRRRRSWSRTRASRSRCA